MTWTNASNPPDDCRTVLCLLADGTECEGWASMFGGRWYPAVGEMQAINPVGWREIETEQLTNGH